MKKKILFKKMGFFRQIFIILINLCQLLNLTFGIHCEKIKHPACIGLGYNTTAMPNLAGHQNILDAEKVVIIFFSVILVFLIFIVLSEMYRKYYYKREYVV